MKVIRNRIIPFGRRYGAINLFGTLFVKPDMSITPELLNHERIHTSQMKELLYIPFYLAYMIEWICRLIFNKFNPYNSYMAISFEKEAYIHSHDLDYLSHRRPFAQWRSR